MATITLHNATTSTIFVRDLYDSFNPDESFQITRSLAELAGMNSLNELIENGALVVDSIQGGTQEQAWLRNPYDAPSGNQPLYFQSPQGANPTADLYATAGSNISVNCGNGGRSNDLYSSPAGVGGSVEITAGNGGSGSVNFASGNGGFVFLKGGDAGNNTLAGGPGYAGFVSIIGGGSNNGSGGDLELQGGTGSAGGGLINISGGSSPLIGGTVFIAGGSAASDQDPASVGGDLNLAGGDGFTRGTIQLADNTVVTGTISPSQGVKFSDTTVQTTAFRFRGTGLASPPASPIPGDMYIDNAGSPKVFIYSGATWLQLN